MICAVAYTGGPFPLGYHGSAISSSSSSFGLVGRGRLRLRPDAGSDLVRDHCVLPIACLATAIIVANNLRDIESDRAAGKHTLATDSAAWARSANTSGSRDRLSDPAGDGLLR